jgi:inhibitor of KinA sporulation pathway (predicted exonuclease)
MDSVPRYVVYDLEYTSWEGAFERRWSKPDEHREIIQIGAVLVDAEFHELGHFRVLVRPRLNPLLSDYVTALTGITQSQLNRCGIDLNEAFGRLRELGQPGLPFLSNGDDGSVIAENCRLAGLDNPFLGRTVDVHDELLAASGRPRLVSADLVELFGLGDLGRGHDALADARAVAGALAKIRFGG